MKSLASSRCCEGLTLFTAPASRSLLLALAAVFCHFLKAKVGKSKTFRAKQN